jgi:hypothetical protein
MVWRRDKRGNGDDAMKGFGAIAAAVLGVLALVVVGGYFALKRPDIAYATLDAKYANAQSKWLDLGDGVSMHYRIEGAPEGRTLLLVHGFSASLHTWEPWAAILGAKYRIVSLDLPGHGLTLTPPGFSPSPENYADLVESAAQKLGLGKVVLAGNSMGGGIAWPLKTFVRRTEELGTTTAWAAVVSHTSSTDTSASSTDPGSA